MLSGLRWHLEPTGSNRANYAPALPAIIPASSTVLPIVGEKDRRGKVLDFAECNSRPQIGSLHPMAIEVCCFSITKSTVF
jgi:hypothetical protein